jgi:hypothetical protein
MRAVSHDSTKVRHDPKAEHVATETLRRSDVGGAILLMIRMTFIPSVLPCAMAVSSAVAPRRIRYSRSVYNVE